MAVNIKQYKKIIKELAPANITLVAVSKVRTPVEIMELYQLGQRDFGENYVQELVDKYEKLPKDIRWHFIGHLQSNKVKYIAPFIYLIHGVDRPNLLKEINKQALKNDRNIDCLLQVHIAEETTKFGFDKKELKVFLAQITANDTAIKYPNVHLRGLMGMATFTFDEAIIQQEFKKLKKIFETYFPLKGLAGSDQDNKALKPCFLSMGMSADYSIAIQEGSNMVRIGSLLFGARI